MSVKNDKTDVLVIGGGLAGWRAAVAAAEAGAEVLLVQKGVKSSPMVMGFNAPVTEGDSAEKFEEDLERSSCEVGDPSLRKTLACGAEEQVRYFEAQGFVFDRDQKGQYSVLGVLGCGVPRLVQRTGYTGKLLLEHLENRGRGLGVRTVDGRILGLAKENGRVCGGYGQRNDGTPLKIKAKSVVIAAGGSSAMFETSTYPSGMTGDGLAMALRAGARLVDIEFQQFEPCCFIYPPELKGSLAVTTMLLKGGELRNNLEQSFMKQNGRTGYQVQKNVLAECIMEQVRCGRGTEHGGVWYDVTMLPEQIIREDNALFYEKALRCGVDLTRQRAEVAPVAHTNLGGILIDRHCRTDVPGLFAAGEAIGGLHGANRIGGCAGTETLVFGAIAGASAAKYAASVSAPERIDWESVPDIGGGETLRKEISRIVSQCLGYDKNEQGLEDGYRRLCRLEEETGANDCGILLMAKAQILASLQRKESRGVFRRLDFMEQNGELDGYSFAVSWKDGLLSAEKLRCGQ